MFDFMCLQVYRYIGYISWSSHKWQIPIPTTLFKEQGGRVTGGDSFILSHRLIIMVTGGGIYNLVHFYAAPDTHV